MVVVLSDPRRSITSSSHRVASNPNPSQSLGSLVTSIGVLSHVTNAQRSRRSPLWISSAPRPRPAQPELFLVKTLPSIVILFTIALTPQIAPVSSYSPSSLISVSSPSSSSPSALATLANFFFNQSLFWSSLNARSVLCNVLTSQRVQFEGRNKRATNRTGHNDKQLVVKIYLAT